ncbi:MAG: ABC-type Fe3+ transport system, periplasmic component [Candidatus Atelocyanobacterium thalassa isolate SIO64986]|uniref:ABC-type Fe3+ transport system, periplasmic component n=1 Tax=Candidatus Atelocyanobacterium thalassa isolate SIO64986 TaxID=1527444 RepID=A0A086CG71_9CHRO|nr:MAG: ABC-type Fe3+ transport system, periplasmic component [Candidatus Atelocyanobacterium thalassa isolate SIO64986]
MIKFSRRLFLSGLTALTVISAMQIITSCSDTSKVSKNIDDKNLEEVNLYSSRHYNTDTELYEGFTKETGIEVNLVEGSADELIERIKSEGENTKADVFMTVDVGRLWRAQKTNIFTPVSSPVLEERIPAPLRDKDGYWFGFTKRSRVIVYNKSKVKPEELSTYESLADTKWKGRIIIRPSSNIYNQSLVASLIEANGEEATEEWVRGFVANFARSPQSNDTGQIRDVAAGVGDITLANTYYMARFAKSDDPIDKEVIKKIGVFFPNQEGRGAHVNISGAGVVRNSPNQANAIKFLEYLTSNKAQEFFARGNDEYPVVEGAMLDPVLKSFGTFKADDTNIASFGENLSTAVKVMNRAGWK